MHLPNGSGIFKRDFDGDFNGHSAKTFMDTYKSPILTKIFHIRRNKSISQEGGGCLLHFDTKLMGNWLINNRVIII